MRASEDLVISPLTGKSFKTPKKLVIFDCNKASFDNFSFLEMRIKHLNYIFFFYCGFLSPLFTNHRAAGKGKGISLTPHHHFHPLYKHLDISRAITVESSPLHIGSSWTRTGNLWFPNANR